MAAKKLATTGRLGKAPLAEACFNCLKKLGTEDWSYSDTIDLLMLAGASDKNLEKTVASALCIVITLSRPLREAVEDRVMEREPFQFNHVIS